MHTYGQACELAALGALCRKHGLRLIEDCAEAFGTRVGTRHVGTFGDVATFSFFGNKTVTTGEGGMITTRDAPVHALICKLRGPGPAGEKDYWHEVVGDNHPITKHCAPIGLPQNGVGPAAAPPHARFLAAHNRGHAGLAHVCHRRQLRNHHALGR